MKIIGLFLFAATLLTTSGAFAVDQLVPMTANTLINIPYGDSNWTPPLDHTYTLNPLQLRYTPSRACPSVPPVSILVHFQGDNVWYTTTVEANGYFRHKGGIIDGISIYFKQLHNHWVQCQVQVYGLAAQPTYEAHYVGVIHYQGGYQHRATVQWEQPLTAQFFEIKVPEFCARGEIVEAGTIQEGEHFVAGTKVDAQGRNLYTFAAPMNLNNLALSFNGPRDSGCDLPVYAFVVPK